MVVPIQDQWPIDDLPPESSEWWNQRKQPSPTTFQETPPNQAEERPVQPFQKREPNDFRIFKHATSSKWIPGAGKLLAIALLTVCLGIGAGIGAFLVLRSHDGNKIGLVSQNTQNNQGAKKNPKDDANPEIIIPAPAHPQPPFSAQRHAELFLAAHPGLPGQHAAEADHAL